MNCETNCEWDGVPGISFSNEPWSEVKTSLQYCYEKGFRYYVADADSFMVFTTAAEDAVMVEDLDTLLKEAGMWWGVKWNG